MAQVDSELMIVQFVLWEGVFDCVLPDLDLKLEETWEIGVFKVTCCDSPLRARHGVGCHCGSCCVG